MRLVGGELYEEGLVRGPSALPGSTRAARRRAMPLGAEFDVVGAFDVLEHVDEDEAVLAGMRRARRPGGGGPLLVPQHPGSGASMDEIATTAAVHPEGARLEGRGGAGLEVVRGRGSFVSSLLPAMMAVNRGLSACAPSGAPTTRSR